MVRGGVIRGRHEGSGMGFPTANLQVPDGIQVPADGAVSYTHLDVYKRQAVLVLFDRKRGGNVFQRMRDALGLIGRAIDAKICLLYTSRCV